MRLSRNHIGFICVTLSLMFHIFFVKFNFFPYYSLLPYILFGGVFFLLDISKGNNKYIYNIIFILILIMWGGISYIYNMEGDYYYLKEVIVISIFYFFSAIAIKRIFYFFNIRYTIENVLFYILFAWGGNIILSTIANIYPDILSLLLDFINIDGWDKQKTLYFANYRYIGVFQSFFGFGVINSFFLILFMWYIVRYSATRLRYIFIAVYLIFSVLGLMFSRTTIIGIVLSLLLAILNFKRKNILIILCFYILSATTILFGYSDLFSEKVMFGLEFLINYENSQAAGSMESLSSFWSILPTNMESWILGEGYFKNIDNFGSVLGYYKGTDVGFSRIIFANGVIGLVLLCGYIFFLFKMSFRGVLIPSLLFVCFLLLNVKGVALPYSFIYLFFIMDKESYNV
ncbi:hypothetical protein Q7526_02520 [Glaesserella parasuis]|uniref:Type 1 secretion C-terminal target domain n=1 Tax=Glaesserella parasuis TaxID=738 RepID=T1RPW7_GLAPU|nr:type 1 secretion C-terminal target domain [Glaesserella parasuis]MDD2169059.1 hypothetical protein [Glaesserella parasuis]MDO9796101.1 hypothetical protein [Glaesserella parasuis]MDP0310331.1 hypothetical protein [Glaesserella parasuis]MDP0329969.1 hypothetical protein [Glaesserella parasuis]